MATAYVPPVLPVNKHLQSSTNVTFQSSFAVADRKVDRALRCTHASGLQRHRSARVTSMKTMAEVCKVGKKRHGDLITGKVFVLGDNIDTDQIIPAEHLTLVPSKPDEYEKLGSFALIGLPDQLYPVRYIKEGSMHTEYPIIIAGENFGCGSSREHAPIALGACGAVAVVAQSYARIFFRNCSSTGELYPWESVDRLIDHFTTGQVATIDFQKLRVTNEDTGDQFELRSLGDVLPVVDAGGIFEFARRSGMISTVRAE